MREKLRKMLSILLVIGMFLQDSQALAAYAAEEITELGNQPNRELSELKEGVTEEILSEQIPEKTGDSQTTEGADHFSAVEGAEEPGEAESTEDPAETGETESPAGTEDLAGIEGTKEPEPLREPESYEPEEEEPEGTLVHYDEDSRTYYLGEQRYRTIFGNSGTYLDEDGQMQLIDNTLEELPKDAAMAILNCEEDAALPEGISLGNEGAVYGNTANRYQVLIPEILEKDRGFSCAETAGG